MDSSASFEEVEATDDDPSMGANQTVTDDFELQETEGRLSSNKHQNLLTIHSFVKYLLLSFLNEYFKNLFFL
jgi:hypothetical protein